jgi:hypothetical protein
MATLNGTQINQTYRGLVKLDDNAVAGSTLKELTDGNGNGLGLFVNTSGSFTAQGDLTVQGVVDSTGANKIAFFYDNQAAFPSATSYHGAIAHSHADGKMYFAHAGAWVELANSADITSLSVDDVTLENDATNGLQVKDDAITSGKLADEFKTASTITPTSGAATLDFSASQVFNVVMTEDTTFTFSNDSVGMVKDLLLSGGFAPIFPAGVNTIAGTYDGTVENFIQIVTTDTGEYWMSISKAI